MIPYNNAIVSVPLSIFDVDFHELVLKSAYTELRSCREKLDTFLR